MRRRARRGPLLLLALLAGAAVAAAVPALAPGSPAQSTASFTAQDFSWHVTGSTSGTVTIAVGGTVTFGYPTGASTHNADFSGGPAPSSCTQTAGTPGGTPPPLPTTPTAPGWAGTCTFGTPGTYTFHCDLHPFMSGTIVVADPNAPPPPTTTGGGSTGTGGGSTGTTPTAPPPPTGGGGGGGSSGATTPAGASPGATPGGRSAAGGSASAPSGGGRPNVRVSVARVQRGTVVRGAVVVPVAGSRVDATALVSNAELATHRLRGRVRAVRVGERRLRAKAAGPTAFAVSLDAAARGALRRRHRLAVTLRVVVTAPGGRAIVRTVRVVVRPQRPAPPPAGY